MNKEYLYKDIYQSDPWFTFCNSVGWKRVILDTNLSARVFKTMLGPFIVVENAKKIDEKTLSKIEKFARNNKAVYLQIKPGLAQDDNILENNGYKYVKKPIGVTKTGIIDLRNSIDYLYKNSSKYVRQITRTSKNKTNIYITNNYSNKEINEFYNVYRKNGSSKRFFTYSKNNFHHFMESFKDKAYLCTARDKKGKYLGGCVFVHEEKIAWYMFAALNNRGRKLSQGYNLLWEGIVFLKNKGFKFLDLGGLYDERYPKVYKHHQGYTSFKKHFHPDIVYYLKTRIKYFNKLYKLIYQI